MTQEEKAERILSILAFIGMLFILFCVADVHGTSNPEGIQVAENLEIRVPDGPFPGSPSCEEDPNMCDKCHYRLLKIPVTEVGRITWIQNGCVTRSLMGWVKGDTAWLKVRLLSVYDSIDAPETWKGAAIGHVKIQLPSGQWIVFEDYRDRSCSRYRPVRRRSSNE